MKSAWSRIERWLTAHAPSILADMLPGASDTEIRAAQQQFGCTFPQEVREWFALHNGARSCCLLEYWDLYSLAEMVASWRSLKSIYDSGFFNEFHSEPQGPIRTEWWHPAWIPLTGEPGGDHLCLDLAPAQGGCVGQIILWVHDDSLRQIVAPTFSAWFAQLADGLEAGVYKLDRHGVLVRIGGPEDVADNEPGQKENNKSTQRRPP
jgi:cell wall assembly regulator SMI1